MISYCKGISKIAALIPAGELKKIKTYLKNQVTAFCDEYYDQLYYYRPFTLNYVFSDEDLYMKTPLNAIYDYYIKIGKTEKDAKIFTLLDLNCVLEEILSESSKTFRIESDNTHFRLPSYQLIAF